MLRATTICNSQFSHVFNERIVVTKYGGFFFFLFSYNEIFFIVKIDWLKEGKSIFQRHGEKFGLLFKNKNNKSIDEINQHQTVCAIKAKLNTM